MPDAVVRSPKGTFVPNKVDPWQQLMTMMLLTTLIVSALCMWRAEAFVGPNRASVKLAKPVSPKIEIFPNSEIRPSSALAAVAIPDPDPYLRYPAPPAPKKFRLMPLRNIMRFLGVYFVPSLVFAGMFLVNTTFSILFIFLKFWMRKIKMRRYGGFKTAYQLTPWTELQFDFARMLTYFPYLIRASDNLFRLRHKMRSANELVGETIVPSDEQFISQVILRSPMAFYTKNLPNKLVTDMSKLTDIDNYQFTYYDVTQIDIDKRTSEITIYTKQDGPVTKASGEDAWKRAKMHALTSISYFIPGIGHSWVHFCFMDAVSATVHNSVKRNTVLYKLLEPHTRYTNRINWEALGVEGNLVFGGTALVRMAAEATSTAPRGIPPPFLIKTFEPWTAFSLDGAEFVRKNAQRTTEYYFRSEEFACPPKWLDAPEAELPYIKSLKRFYPIVRAHVEEVLSHETDSTIEGFIDAVDQASEVDGFSLNLKRFKPIDVIASILFDGIFIHSTDHYFTNEVFAAARYGVGTIRNPYPRWWFPGMMVPGDILDPEDRVRWIGFTNVFVKFNDSKVWSNGMASLKYKFRNKELQGADKRFVKRIEEEQTLMQKEGDIYCPMPSLSRSICF